MPKKEFYSPQDVNQLIPQLESVFEHIESCKARAEALAFEAIQAPAGSRAREVAETQLVRSQVEFLMEAVQDDIHHILSLGGVTKDLELGLVDFPGEMDGQDIWLCWRKGEPRVRFWHSLEEGFGQRQALPGVDSATLH